MIFGIVEGGLADSQQEILSHPAIATKHEKVPPNNLAMKHNTHTRAQAIWAGSILIATVLALIKISTLVLYQRVFVIIPTFRLVCSVVMALTVGWYITYIFVSLVAQTLL